jgi:methyl-accepting chemotaxis protein
MITRAATDLFQRVAALTPSEWLTAIGVAALIGAVAWIGRNVGRLLELQSALAERLRIAEGNLTNAQDAIARVDEMMGRVDAALARRMILVERRQTKIESSLEHAGKDWRDDDEGTKDLRFTGPRTTLDLRKP